MNVMENSNEDIDHEDIDHNVMENSNEDIDHEDIDNTVINTIDHTIFKIHKNKKKNGVDLYLIEWEDFPEKKDFTWEPVENLTDCDMFHEYVLSKQNNTKKRNQGILVKDIFKKTKRDTLSKENNTKKRKQRKQRNQGILVKDIFKKTKRDTLSKDERFDIIRFQNYKCNCCLNPLGSSYFEIDHIIPIEQGGTGDLANLQGLCSSCHIYKTTVLDRGVIARLLQAKVQSKNSSKITRNEILEECQMVFANRNRQRVPFHDDEILNFCISSVDIFREMCKKKVKNIMDNMYNLDNMKDSSDSNDSNLDMKINEVDLDNKINNPPKPFQLSLDNIQNKSEYLINLLIIIKNLITLKIKSNITSMDSFDLHIKINEGDESDEKKDDEIYNELNNFFKEIYHKKLKNSEKKIGKITIIFTKNQ